MLCVNTHTHTHTHTQKQYLPTCNLHGSYEMNMKHLKSSSAQDNKRLETDFQTVFILNVKLIIDLSKRLLNKFKRGFKK